MPGVAAIAKAAAVAQVAVAKAKGRMAGPLREREAKSAHPTSLAHIIGEEAEDSEGDMESLIKKLKEERTDKRQ